MFYLYGQIGIWKTGLGPSSTSVWKWTSKYFECRLNDIILLFPFLEYDYQLSIKFFYYLKKYQEIAGWYVNTKAWMTGAVTVSRKGHTFCQTLMIIFNFRASNGFGYKKRRFCCTDMDKWKNWNKIVLQP